MRIGYDRDVDVYGDYAAVILAAGFSSRMGDFKPLMPVDGSPALHGLAESLRSAGVEDIVTVSGYRREDLAPHIGKLGMTECYNEDFRSGMFSSIKAGLGKAREMYPDSRGYLLIPVDCPLVSIEVIRKVIAGAEKEGGGRFAVPVYEGKKGHPLLVPSGLVGEITGYDGPGGLKGVTDRYRSSMIRVPVGDEGCVLDMDTPEAYDDLRHFVTRGFRREDLELLAARKRIILVRHGETEQHSEPVFIGQYDVPLSGKGRAQAAAAGDRILEIISPDIEKELSRRSMELPENDNSMPAAERIYTSDLARASETAEIIKDRINGRFGSRGFTLDTVEHKGLREIALGEWDGRPVREIREEHPDLYEERGRDMFTFKTGNRSENFYDMQYRAVAALRDILRNDYSGNVIIVAHSGVIRALENNLRGLRVDDPWDKVAKGDFAEVDCRVLKKKWGGPGKEDEKEVTDVNIFDMKG